MSVDMRCTFKCAGACASYIDIAHTDALSSIMQTEFIIGADRNTLHTHYNILTRISATPHFSYIQDIKSYCLDIPGDFPYPIIADPERALAVSLDMIDEEQKNDPEVAKTVRALYIISPDKRLRLSMIYPMSTGRNVE